MLWLNNTGEYYHKNGVKLFSDTSNVIMVFVLEFMIWRIFIIVECI